MRRPALIAILLAVALPGLALPSAAQERMQDRVEVDLELALMVDVSRSMAPGELEIQRRGYAAALGSDDVIDAIRGGLIGSIAVTYVEWAGRYAQRTIVDWTLISTEAEARAVADRLVAEFTPSLRRTSISGALLVAADSMDANRFDGLRRVIDVSGDGPNNEGRPVTLARDEVIARGITVNGLPLMTVEGMGARWHLEDLDAYYDACVIGGPGAFLVPVTDWAQFAEAVRRKLVLEIAGPAPGPGTAPPAIAAPLRPMPAQYRSPPEYDCLIGEKMWERYFHDNVP